MAPHAAVPIQPSMLSTARGIALLAAVAALLAPQGVDAQAMNGGDEVTFSRDVAPILRESCQTCHNPDGMAPMSFISYEEVRPWAPIIKDRVVNRVMPPWHLDRTVGIQEYRNDISLSDEQIETIVTWVNSGAPQGNPDDLPPPIELLGEGEWYLESEFGRPPDLVVTSSPFTMGAGAMDAWYSPTLPFDELDRPVWVKASEFRPRRPDGVKIVHHGHATLHQFAEDGEETVRVLGRYGVGKPADVFPEGTGIRLYPGGEVRWNLHYAAIDTEVPNDQVDIGLWFHPEGEEPELETQHEVRWTAGLPEGQHGMPWAGDIVIPPNSIRLQQGTHVMESAVILDSFRPHMHMRGREQTLEVIYPDGVREVIGKVDRFDHNWQVSYQFEEHVKPILPAGSVLLITTVFDNTDRNPINPDPDQWVVFGQRGPDEMSHMWIGMTYLTEEQYHDQKQRQERLRAEVEREREDLQRQAQALAGEDEDQ